MLSAALAFGLCVGPSPTAWVQFEANPEVGPTPAGQHWREGQFVDVQAPEAPRSPEAEAEAEPVAEAEAVPESEAATSPDAVSEPPAPSLATAQLSASSAETVYVSVGLAPELYGTQEDLALLDTLETGVRASPAPRADLRRLRVGSSPAKVVCGEGRDDLVITIGSLPNRAEPVLFTRDCLLDRELGVRAMAAASDPDFLGVLWAEHLDAIAAGAKPRRRVPMSPKVRTGLIAGAAVVVVGAAVGLLIAGVASSDSVLIRVSPE